MQGFAAMKTVLAATIKKYNLLLMVDKVLFKENEIALKLFLPKPRNEEKSSGRNEETLAFRMYKRACYNIRSKNR
jgi:hypothetical protein